MGSIEFFLVVEVSSMPTCVLVCFFFSVYFIYLLVLLILLLGWFDLCDRCFTNLCHHCEFHDALV